MGFETVKNWPSLYCKETDKGPMVIDVYVDDLVTYGLSSLLQAAIKQIRTKINMKEPHPLGRYLGKSVTEVEFNMTQYFASKVKAYVRDTGKTMRRFDTPHAPTLVSVVPMQCLANANGPLLQLFCCETHFAIFAWRMLIRVKCSTQIHSGPK